MGLASVLPRISFFLDFEYYMKTLPDLAASCHAYKKQSPTNLKTTFMYLLSLLIPCRWPTESIKSPAALFKALRQPFKLSLAITIASAGVLSERARGVLGPRTYWAAVTITKIMTPTPTSSYNNAVSRILGTAMGATFGLALFEWFNVRDGWPLAALLAVWVFFCR